LKFATFIVLMSSSSGNTKQSPRGSSSPRVNSCEIVGKRTREELGKDHEGVSPQRNSLKEIYLGVPASEFIQAAFRDGREKLANDLQRRASGNDRRQETSHCYDGDLTATLDATKELGKDKVEVSSQGVPSKVSFLGWPASQFIQAIHDSDVLADGSLKRAKGNDKCPETSLPDYGNLGPVLELARERDRLYAQQQAWFRERVILTQEIDRLRRNQKTHTPPAAGQHLGRCVLSLNKPGSSSLVGVDLKLSASLPLTIRSEIEDSVLSDAGRAKP
jgi:hypothetical protein